MNGYLETGDIAPLVIWEDGPGFTRYTVVRDSIYNFWAVPSFEVNGSTEVAGWSLAAVQAAIETELSVPCHLSINCLYSGNASGGTVSYLLTAEQDLGETQMTFWSSIIEDHEIATPAYGEYYQGQELMWEPRSFPAGACGQTVTFSGPYPQTITVNASYTLDPATMSFDNLSSVAFLQSNASSHAVFNASFMDLPDTNTGIGGGVASPAALSVGPNPSEGILNVYSILPTGEAGIIGIFDICGRMVGEFPAGGAVETTLDTPGVYLVRMQTSSGEVLSRCCTLIR